MDTHEALQVVASAIGDLNQLRHWAAERGTDAPGGEDIAALVGYGHGIVVRIGIEIADQLASEVDAEHGLFGEQPARA